MKRILAFFALLTLTNFSHAQEVGIIMGTARDIMRDNVEEGLIKLKAMGIKHIEGAGARGMSRADYKKLLDKYGFDVVANGVTFEKIENPDSIKTIIENMKFYEVEYAVCYWIPHKGDDFTFADMEKGIAVFNKAGKQFAEAGISLLYHAHGYEFRPYSGPGTMYDYMMKKLDTRYCNIEMDVFWMKNPGQDPAALLRKYPGRFPITHLKDRMIGSINNQNGRQDKERNVVLGTGDVNIAEVLKAAKETGVKYHFIEDESSRAAVQLPLSLEFIRKQNYEVQAIELSVKTLHRVMASADSVGLRYITAEELTYGHSSGTIETKEMFVKNLVSGKSDVVSIDVKDQDITVKGDVAWVRNISTFNMLDNGKSAANTIKVLQVWSKTDGYWKLLARQAVKMAQ